MSTKSKTTTEQVANRLVELCREGKIFEAQQELYDENITSTEPANSPNPSAKGKKAVGEKGKRFAESIEQHHEGSFSDPLVCGNHFSVAMVLDATFAGMGRHRMEEICTYEVKDGKIVAEQFFY